MQKRYINMNLTKVFPHFGSNIKTKIKLIKQYFIAERNPKTK